MRKFGLGKKGDGNDESGRSGLFSRSKSKSPMPAANPYAQLPDGVSAADPYQQAKFNAGVGGYNKAPNSPSINGLAPGPKEDSSVLSRGGYGDGSSFASTDSKSAGNASQYGGGYGSDRYGTQSGYGADRYGGQSPAEERGSRYGPGGYGDLGGASTPNATTADTNREALFGGTIEHSEGQQQPNGLPPPYGVDSSQGRGSGGYGETTGDRGGNSSYEAYGDRQLTAEEEEEEDVQAAKQEIRFLKQSDVSSTRNALRAAAMAEETGRGTLARLGAQGERIHNTEKNLDLTANHNRMAEDKAKELKRLNGSMFAIHPSNPFTASKRREQRDAQVMEKHRMERAEREQSRKEAYQTDKRLEKTFKDLNLTDAQVKANKQSSLAERAKFQFEADSEDEEMENEIDSNLDALGGAATRLNALAKATGKELDEQNRHLERINGKVCHSLFARTNMIEKLTCTPEYGCRRSNRHEQSKVGSISLMHVEASISSGSIGILACIWRRIRALNRLMHVYYDFPPILESLSRLPTSHLSPS